MTPFADPETPQEVRFNNIHAHTRAVIERTFGLLKGRWMCLDTAGGRLLYAPEKVCRIILACCVLHNLGMAHGVPTPPGAEPQPDGDGDAPLNAGAPGRAAVQARYELLQRLEGEH